MPNHLERQPLSEQDAQLLPRDFIESAEGLLFAVVAHRLEAGRVLCFLRYVRTADSLRKLHTREANELLQQRYGEYLFHSAERDVQLHGVPLERIVYHFRPAQRLAEILAGGENDSLERKVAEAARILGARHSGVPSLGVTGSVLVTAHHNHSDIDLVVYGRDQFHQIRERLRGALNGGKCQGLDERMWRDAYRRRGCSLTFDEYVWHERRKLNKFAFGGTKVDVGCVADEPLGAEGRGAKTGKEILRATVTDDCQAFDYPARYQLGDPEIPEVLSYNPTFTGQAIKGETVEVAGWVERLDDGRLRLVVGTTREATGEYIKVLRS